MNPSNDPGHGDHTQEAAAPVSDPIDDIVTPSQLDVLDKLSEFIDAPSSAFACGGVIPESSLPLKDVILFISGNETARVARMPLDAQSISTITNASLPSHHGVGEETVHDPSYRNAKEITIPYFALSPDPTTHAGILGVLQHKLVHPRPLRAELYKLNVYGGGGFFKPHRDTPRGETHIGTLLLSLPSSYTGGALAVRQDNSEILFDWSQSTSLEWAFLYSDCEHEVLPVTSGHRITIQYNIFDTLPPDASDLLVSSDSRFKFFDSMIDSLIEPNNPLTLAFALRHEYPRDRQISRRLADLAARLKGHDKILLQAVQARGLTCELRVVWRMTEKNWQEYDSDKLCSSQGYRDAFAQLSVDSKGASQKKYSKLHKEMISRVSEDFRARHEAQWNKPFRYRCFTSKSFRILEDAYVEESMWRYLEKHRAQIRDDILWISKPKQYDGKISYTAYGNEAQAASVYTAIALLVHVPGAEKGH